MQKTILEPLQDAIQRNAKTNNRKRKKVYKHERLAHLTEQPYILRNNFDERGC